MPIKPLGGEIRRFNDAVSRSQSVTEGAFNGAGWPQSCPVVAKKCQHLALDSIPRLIQINRLYPNAMVVQPVRLVERDPGCWV
jgi:hypothetical protein